MAAPVPLGTQQNGDNRTGGTFDGQRAAMSTPAPAPAPAPAPEESDILNLQTRAGSVILADGPMRGPMDNAFEARWREMFAHSARSRGLIQLVRMDPADATNVLEVIYEIQPPAAPAEQQDQAAAEQPAAAGGGTVVPGYLLNPRT